MARLRSSERIPLGLTPRNSPGNIYLSPQGDPRRSVFLAAQAVVVRAGDPCKPGNALRPAFFYAGRSTLCLHLAAVDPMLDPQPCEERVVVFRGCLLLKVTHCGYHLSRIIGFRNKQAAKWHFATAGRAIARHNDGIYWRPSILYRCRQL